MLYVPASIPAPVPFSVPGPVPASVPALVSASAPFSVTSSVPAPGSFSVPASVPVSVSVCVSASNQASVPVPMLESLLTKSQVADVLKSRDIVCGISALDNELFVVCYKKSQGDVYSCQDNRYNYFVICK